MTSLLAHPRTKPVWTLNREVSGARAPLKSLAIYLREMIEGPEGWRPKQVIELKAEPEVDSAYPAICVYTDAMEYSAQDGSLSPYGDERSVVKDAEGTEHLLLVTNEVKITARLHVWANEMAHREGIMLALEDMLCPEEGASGFWLDMPHYHGARASFLLQDVSYEDSEGENQRRYRRAMVSLECHSPIVRVQKVPRVRPFARVDVT